MMPRSAPEHDSLETIIGSRWLLYVGVLAVLVGVAYFEKLAFDNHWINETIRVAQGAVVGLLMLAGGQRIIKKGPRAYGEILSGCGLAILYVSTYAAFNFYGLINRAAAFGLMSAVTSLAAWLSNRHRSQALALVAVGGGFLTPFLLPTAVDTEAALFAYDAILIAGTLALSRRRDWPLLNLVSYSFTVLTFLGWAVRFYTPSKYLVTELFLTLFCAMFVFIRRQIHPGRDRIARTERTILATAPIGYYVLSMFILSNHSVALLIYVVMLSLVGVMSSRSSAPMRLLFWVAAAVPLLAWSGAHGGETWLVAGLSAWSGIFMLFHVGLFDGTVARDRKFSGFDIALVHLNGLVPFAGAYLLMQPVRTDAAAAPLAGSLALLNGALGAALFKRFRDQSMHFAALGFALLGIAVALRFDNLWITVGWAAEGTALMWLGLRERREWLRLTGVIVFGVAISGLVALQFSAPTVGESLLFNRRALCGALIIAFTYAATLVHSRLSQTSMREVEVGAGLLTAQLLSFTFAASEIVAYWTLHPASPFEPDAQVIIAALTIGVAIIWLGLRRRQEWLRGVGAFVCGVAALSLFSIQLQSAPVGYVAALNARAAAGTFAVLVLCALVVIHRRHGSHLSELEANVAILTTGAALLTLSLLTSEIDAFWAARGADDIWSTARDGQHAIAWGAIGAFLMWQGVSNRGRLTQRIGSGLLIVGVLRLLDLQFAPSMYAVVANARVMTSIAMIAIFYALARMYSRARDGVVDAGLYSMVLLLIANVLTLTLLTSEITAYWRVHDLRPSSITAAADRHFVREMMLSITWAAYATLLVIIGLWRRYAPIRYFAMTVFAIATVKVFAVDMAELERLYRVVSIIGLGAALLLTSYLYQKHAARHARSQL